MLSLQNPYGHLESHYDDSQQAAPGRMEQDCM